MNKICGKEKTFALIGAAGYIAPRHMKAIKETGNNLVAVLDRSDSVGIIDSYYPNADFFTEFERFDRHIEKLRRKNGEKSVEYITICSPNYLHDAHIRFGLRVHSDVICEKPLVLNPWNVDALAEIESESDNNIYNILQLRLHPTIRELRARVQSELERDSSRIYDVELRYVASRGKWYQYSWKGDEQKSGGIATNIGVHFFDMLIWIFGDVLENEVYIKENGTNAGTLRLEHANVKWLLSVEAKHLPTQAENGGNRTFRSIKIDGKEFEFSSGFTDLHTESYKQILTGKGFGITEVKSSITLVHDIRVAAVSELEKADPFFSDIRL